MEIIGLNNGYARLYQQPRYTTTLPRNKHCHHRKKYIPLPRKETRNNTIELQGFTADQHEHMRINTTG
jgi:hypothetical protein